MFDRAGSVLTVIPLGGAEEVGASSLQVTWRDLTVIIDYGARPGVRDPQHALPDHVAGGRQPNAILASHAHHDHTGAIPALIGRYRDDIPVYGSSVTHAISGLLVADSLRLSEADPNNPAAYSALDARRYASCVVSVAPYVGTTVARSSQGSLVAHFLPAGHILGASSIVLEARWAGGGLASRILVSGDISLLPQPILDGADLPAIAEFGPYDLVVCEGTYGPTEPVDSRESAAHLAASVMERLDAGGRVIVPAFAVGRSQNVLATLLEAMVDGTELMRLSGKRWKERPWPLLVDGMVRAACDLTNDYRHLVSGRILDLYGSERHIFFGSTSPAMRVTGAGRTRLAQTRSPYVAIASSGMLSGGAIVNYLKAVASDRDAALFFTGYLDEESPGRAVLRMAQSSGSRRLRIQGEVVDVKCRVQPFLMPGHASGQEIVGWLATANCPEILLVHGDAGTLARLRPWIENSLRDRRIDASVRVAKRGHAYAVRTSRERERLNAVIPIDASRDVALQEASDLADFALSAVLHGHRGPLSASELRIGDNLVGERVSTLLAGGGDDVQITGVHNERIAYVGHDGRFVGRRAGLDRQTEEALQAIPAEHVTDGDLVAFWVNGHIRLGLVVNSGQDVLEILSDLGLTTAPPWAILGGGGPVAARGVLLDPHAETVRFSRVNRALSRGDLRFNGDSKRGPLEWALDTGAVPAHMRQKAEDILDSARPDGVVPPPDGADRDSALEVVETLLSAGLLAVRFEDDQPVVRLSGLWSQRDHQVLEPLALTVGRDFLAACERAVRAMHTRVGDVRAAG